MRFSVLLTIAMSLTACASGHKGTSASAPAPAENTAQSNPPATKGDHSAAPSVETSKVTCTHAKDSRTLELRAKAKGCELGYTKGGKESVVATSLNGTKHCSDKMDGIKDKLVKAGFTCQ